MKKPGNTGEVPNSNRSMTGLKNGAAQSVRSNRSGRYEGGSDEESTFYMGGEKTRSILGSRRDRPTLSTITKIPEGGDVELVSSRSKGATISPTKEGKIQEPNKTPLPTMKHYRNPENFHGIHVSGWEIFRLIITPFDCCRTRF